MIAAALHQKYCIYIYFFVFFSTRNPLPIPTYVAPYLGLKNAGGNLFNTSTNGLSTTTNSFSPPTNSTNKSGR